MSAGKVLAVMDDLLEWFDSDGYRTEAHRVREARDAVAELVASAREAAKQLRLAGDAAHAAHLEGALARFGGAS